MLKHLLWARERVQQLVSSFRSRFSTTVVKRTQPVFAASDLRLTDVFTRFVEHECADKLDATVDVIKSTHVRFPSHVSLPPSQVCSAIVMPFMLQIVGMVAHYEPNQSVRQLRSELFGPDAVGPLTDAERRDKIVLRMAMPDCAPAFAHAIYSIGLDLVQERVRVEQSHLSHVSC